MPRSSAQRYHLIAYLPVGFRPVEDSIRAGKVLAGCGVDVIELGFRTRIRVWRPDHQRATVAARAQARHPPRGSFPRGGRADLVRYFDLFEDLLEPGRVVGRRAFRQDFAAVSCSLDTRRACRPRRASQWEAASGQNYDLERIYSALVCEHRARKQYQNVRAWICGAIGLDGDDARRTHVAGVVEHPRRPVRSASAWASGFPTALRPVRSVPARGRRVGSALVKNSVRRTSTVA